MKTRKSFHFIVILSLLLVTLPVQATRATPAASAAPASLLQFTSGGHALGFATSGMYAASGSHALHVDFAGAYSVQPQAPGQDSASPSTEADGKSAPLSRVTYAHLWDGISLTYTSETGSLYTTTYTLAPQADPADIRLRYNTPPNLNKDGSLGISFETGSLTESAPVAWQEINGQRAPVQAAFRVSGQEVGFALGAYNPNFTLTIDPSLVWNAFLGGKIDNDYGTSIAVDGSGNVYVTGYSDTAWGTPKRIYSGGKDAFVTKLDSSGGLVWSTFLGGPGEDVGYGIAVDASGGTLYVTGESTGFWGTTPVHTYTLGIDTFAAKLLASSGGIVWNTFLGGSGDDEGRGIAVDGSGNVYVAGDSTASWGSSPLRAHAGQIDAYIAKLNSSGALTWNTFLGGSRVDYGRGIAVDVSGNSVYVTGSSYASWSCSPNLCTQRAYTPGWDAFAAKLDSSGALLWNSFLGGSSTDNGNSIAVDGSGNVYVTGYSGASWGIPIRTYTNGWDAFAAKLDSSGALIWNTFLGGADFDYGYGIAVDGGGNNVYVTGHSKADWTCTGTPCTGKAYSGDYDAFAAKLYTSSGILDRNTFLGGSSTDQGYGIAVGADGYVYLAGNSGAAWGCTPTNCTVGYYTGGQDAFADKLDWNVQTNKWNTFLGGSGDDTGYGIAVDGSGNVYVTGYSDAPWSCSPAACTRRSYAGGGDAFVAKLAASGALLWNTFLGSNDYDKGLGIAVDGSGNVYVTGLGKASWDNPARLYTGNWDAFAARLDSSGVLIWNTFLGGDGTDYGYGIAVDGSGNVYVAGYSIGAWGCLPACTARAYAGGGDAFAAKLDPSTGALIWNSFLGSIEYDQGMDIAVDGGGNAYVTGLSSTPWSCSPAACTQRAYTGYHDAFAAKLDSSGALLWNTFLGGSGWDTGYGITVDGSGNVYVKGNSTTSWGSPESNFTGGENGFVAKLNPSGGLTWNTFLGGGGWDDGNGIAVDGGENVYVTGFSTVTWGAPERAYTGDYDAFAARFNAATGALTWNTFLGGSGWDMGFDIAVDESGDVYVTGKSNAGWGSPVRVFAGSFDAFAVKLDPTPPRVVSSLRLDPNPTIAASVRFTVTFSEPVVGVALADFSLTITGISGAAVTGFGGSGSTYTVTVSTCSGTCTLRLDVVDDDTILDAVGHPLGGVGLYNGNFSGGQWYSVRPPCYTLTMAHTGSGGDPTAIPTHSDLCSSGQYLAGESITLTASPAAGWAVGSWSGTSNNSSTSRTNSVIMPSGDQTVTANYTLQPPSCYTLTMAHTGLGGDPTTIPPHWSLCSSGQYLAGESITLTASPAAGWAVGSWSGTSNDSSTSSTNSVIMPSSSQTVVVNYTQNTYRIYLPQVIR